MAAAILHNIALDNGYINNYQDIENEDLLFYDEYNGDELGINAIGNAERNAYIERHFVKFYEWG